MVCISLTAATLPLEICTFKKQETAVYLFGGNEQPSNNSLIEKCIAVFNGAYEKPTNLAGDGFCWYGFGNNAAKGSNNIIRQCVSLSNINCAYEFAFQDSLKMEDNYGSRNGNGVELWGYVTNSLFQRNKILNVIPEGISWGHGNGFWMANSTIQPGITGGNNNNKIFANVFATSWQETIDIEGGVHEVVGNLFFDPSRRRNDNNGSFITVGMSGGVDSINVTFKNNILYQPNFHTRLVGAFNIDNSTNSAFLNNNYYFSQNGAISPFIYKGTNYGSGFNAYRSATGQDTKGSAVADPGFARIAGKINSNMYVVLSDSSSRTEMMLSDEDLCDWRLTANSPALSAGDSTVSGTVVGVDFAPFGTSRPVGPYAMVAGSPLSLGDQWIGGLNFRGGTLKDVQASKGNLANADAVVQLSLCK
jgi:hypothetical protein